MGYAQKPHAHICDFKAVKSSIASVALLGVRLTHMLSLCPCRTTCLRTFISCATVLGKSLPALMAALQQSSSTGCKGCHASEEFPTGDELLRSHPRDGYHCEPAIVELFVAHAECTAH